MTNPQVAAWELAQRLPDGDPLREACRLALTFPGSLGRQVRLMPGEVPCADSFHEKPWAHDGARCLGCSGGRAVRESVLGTDEASVVARLKALGLMLEVWDALPVSLAKGQLHLALMDRDYPGAVEAVIEALEALVTE